MKSENAGSSASLTLSSSESSSSLARSEITSFLILRPESNNLHQSRVILESRGGVINKPEYLGDQIMNVCKAYAGLLIFPIREVSCSHLQQDFLSVLQLIRASVS